MTGGRPYDQESNAPLIGLLIGLAAVSCIAGAGVYAIYEATHPEVVEVERVKRPTLPQSCAHLLREVNEEEWNEVTHTYPPNYEWENCMGVGRK